VTVRRPITRGAPERAVGPVRLAAHVTYWKRRALVICDVKERALLLDVRVWARYQPLLGTDHDRRLDRQPVARDHVMKRTPAA
jgi:hypothetical protein